MLFSRRRFLQSSSALLLPALLSRNVFAAANKADIKLGLVTYNWGKDWDVPTLIKNCSETGFSGVELRTEHAHGVELKLDAPARQEIKKQFADSPVKIVGFGTTCEYHSPKADVVKKNIEESKAWVRLAHEVGATGIKVRPNGLPPEVPVEKTLEQIGLAMREVADYAKEYGQDIRLEVHGKGTSEVPHIKTIMEIADRPNAVVCWNCNKTDLNGKGFEYNFDSVKDKIATVHIHNLTIDDYPWEKLFAGLKANSFQGWTLMEENRIPDDIVEAMRKNRKAWEKLVNS